MVDSAAHERAEAYIAARQLDRARDELNAALRQDPNDGDALIMLSQVATFSGDLAGSEQMARLACAIPEHRAYGLVAFARVVGVRGPERAPEALAAATEAVNLEPQIWQMRAALASALADTRDYENARVQAEAAVQLAGADPGERAGALVGLARVFAATPGGQPRAYAVATEAAALDPTNPRIQQLLTETEFGSGKRADALASALAILRQSPTAVLPPVIAQFSLYLLIRRAVGFLLLTSIGVAIVFLGFFGEALGQSAAARLGGGAGLAAYVAVLLTTLGPLTDPSIRRPVWRFGKRRASVWIALVLVVSALLCYSVLALILGSFAGVAFPFALMLIAWIAHLFAAFGLSVPDLESVLRRS
ncbi:tetratricopeptide repeat protein [Microbacterium sp. P02]|uniref:tetratricopeptide repeat protein n=1 Tax=Microbacterium sp. P02 TaxID=3366260 RepID=UPI00366AD176